MQKRHGQLNFLILDTIADIPAEDWNRLFGRQMLEGRGYHKTIEESGLKEFSLHYLVAKRNEELVGIIPFFLTDFSFTTIIQGRAQRIILKIQKILPRFLKMKILFVGLPTAEEFYLGISKEEDLRKLIGGALKKLFKFAKKSRAKAALFYNLKDEHAALASYLAKKGFSRMENYPNTVIEIKARSLEEYLRGLSKNMRKDLKRKLKKSSSLASLRFKVTGNIDEITQQIQELYLNNFRDSDVHFEALTPEFFQNITRNMPEEAKYFLTYIEEEIVAFNLCLVKGNTCIDKFIGFNRELSRSHSLYYATFCHNIDWCIKNNVRFYQLGITDYHPKLRLGAKLIPLYIYVKLINPFLNFFCGLMTGLIEPTRSDPTLKKLS
jgi:predicted N-acyltransferase